MSRLIQLSLVLSMALVVSCGGGGGGGGATDDTGGKTVAGLWSAVSINGQTLSAGPVTSASVHLASPVATVQATMAGIGTCQYGGIYSTSGNTLTLTIRYDGLNQYSACGVAVGSEDTATYALTNGGDTLTLTWSDGSTEVYSRTM